MIGMQFVTVGDQSAQDLSTAAQLDSAMAGFDDEGTYASKLQTWDGTKYSTFGWSGSSGTDVLEDDTMNNKWLNVDLEETDDTLAKASAVWIIAEKAGTVTLSGEVPSDASVEVPLVAGFNMVANPYPAEVDVADFGVLDSSYAGFDDEGTYASKLQIWNGTKYTTFGWSGSSGTEVLEDSSLDNKWLNVDLEATDDVVSYGQGVWIIAEKAGSITFTNPAE